MRKDSLDMIGSVLKHLDDQITPFVSEIVEKGLLWRSNLFFVNLLRRSLLERILVAELPRFKSGVCGSRLLPEEYQGCYFSSIINHQKVTVIEKEVIIEDLKSNKSAKIPLPARL